MSVTFTVSKDGKTMTLTPQSRAWIRSQENYILASDGDDFFKANKIHMLYQENSVEEDGTYNKTGWLAANQSRNEQTQDTYTKLNEPFNDLVATAKWATIGIIAVAVYQLIHSLI